MRLPKNNLEIISGGQTGVDRAALDFALHNNVLCRGWCPLGRHAEDGVIKSVYPLSETYSTDTKVRSEMNVLNSHGTLIIVFQEMDQGTQFTFDIALQNNKPVFVWEIGQNKNPLNFKFWMTQNKIEILNIAGPRESFAPGIFEETLNILGLLLADYII